MDTRGELVKPNVEASPELIKHYKSVGDQNHLYYRKELNHFLGPEGLVGLYDILSCLFMWYNTRGAAPTTNVFLSVADYLQVFVARTKMLGDPEHPSRDGEIARQRRVGAMAWTQGLGGIGGITSFISEFLSKNHEEHELSTSKKVQLSLATLASVATMFVSYAEKMILATTSKGKKNGNETSGILLDAYNDIRAISEYLVMAIYPWVRSIKPIKKAIDIAVPILAIRDAIENFVHDGISAVFLKKSNFVFPQKVKTFLKSLFFINGSEKFKIENVKLPGLVGTNWYLGENGIRNKFIAPVFRFLGCDNSPELYVKGENGDKVIVIKSPGIEDEPHLREKVSPPSRKKQLDKRLLVAEGMQYQAQ